MPPCDVFLLAAGLGTRLRPLTNTVPKPLVEVNGVPLIIRHLRALHRQGFTRIMVNLHHLPDCLRSALGDGSQFGVSISYSEEPTLLDTGGGIKNIEPWVQSAELLVVNSDALFDDSLSYASVLQTANEMTLLVGPDRGFTKLFVDSAGKLVQFGGERNEEAVNYLGVMALRRKLIEELPVGTYSITSGVIPRLLTEGRAPGTVFFPGYFNDVGTPERLAAASKDLKGFV